MNSLNPFEEKEIFLQHQFYLKVKIYNLILKVECLFQTNYLDHAKINRNVLFIGLGKTFQIWEPRNFEKFKSYARKKAFQNRSNLKWENKQKGDVVMSINVGGGELRELKPRILVIGVGGAGGNAIQCND